MNTHAFIKEEYDQEFLNTCQDFNPLATYYPPQDNIIAIGDIHGDLNLAINFLKKGKVIEEINKTKFGFQKITETKYTIIIDTLNLKEEVKTTDFDMSKNRAELVYRIYEVSGEYYVKVIQDQREIKDRWFKWIGGKTYVVQVGDQVDRCRPYGNLTCDNSGTTKKDEDSDLEIMLFYDSLDKIAIIQGGRVFSLLGNHEIMNVVGDMRYVSYKGGVEYSPEPKTYDGGIHIRKDLFGTIVSKKMSCTRQTVLIIGSFIFVHGGIAQQLATDYKLLDINEIIRKFLNKSATYNKDIKDLLNSSKISPLWYRKLAYIPSDKNGNQHPECKTLFQPVMKKINETNKPVVQLNGMVVGHTPQFITEGKGITTACNNGIIRVDIGASSAFDDVSGMGTKMESTARNHQVIRITKNKIVTILI